MKFTAKFIIASMLFLVAWSTNAQTLTQTIKGTVLDKDSEMTLIGANVIIKSTADQVGTSTDENGNFRIENVPIGRHAIEISYLGYEPANLNSIMVTSGKELVLNIELQESVLTLTEAVVVAKHDKTKALNEMATVSARSFSVEETARYASSLYDPARMAQNYAGVNLGGGSDDLFNEIIVRGNSPSGVLWRLEGIEIPNPNHFGSTGSTGGGISMLSSSTLSNSDFYTGAFPSEFGNAISGVFDLNLRKGNNEKREHSVMLGLLGVEVGSEGPFSKKYNGSYLINYRYSTLGLLDLIGLNPAGDVLPAYQDLSFKMHLPTKKAGTFSVFGLWGKNIATAEAVADSSQWMYSDDKWSFKETQSSGTIGMSHKLILTPTSYIRTVVAASTEKYIYDDYYLDAANNYAKVFDEISLFDHQTIRATTKYTNKLNAKNTVQLGGVVTHHDFNFEIQLLDNETPSTYLDNKGKTQLYQAFGHWKHRFNDDWTLNSGIHFTHFALNGSTSIEPRAAIKWQANPRQSWSAAVGLHSRPEHVSYYFIEQTEEGKPRTTPNKDLDMTKSLQAVLGYNQKLGDNMRLSIETYYQHLYDVPVVDDPTSRRSIINTQGIWDILGENRKMSNDGTARNYGVDITLEKFFSDNYYFMVTGSIFDSKFTPRDGNEYPTRYASNFQTNILFGKEWKMGKNKKNILGINGKAIIAGGNRDTPIDRVASQNEGRTVRKLDELFGEHMPAYWRFDLGVSYKMNKKKTTHTIMLDLQNVTNHENIQARRYSVSRDELVDITQTGLFPSFNYRIEF